MIQGRLRRWSNDAERQRAYRDRLRGHPTSWALRDLMLRRALREIVAEAGTTHHCAASRALARIAALLDDG